ncbi:MAG TPA: GxxExxY protein [Blastocatellia bacterium]|nr:GxxExxY protein [Blastocatellia bacterium]
MDDNAITEIIIGCAFEAHNKLGSGFLEKVYENALCIELRKKGLKVKQQEQIKVWYEGQVVGHYSADLWVEDRIIVELKAVQSLTKEHELQVVNYLTATGVDTGLLINFGSSVQVKRKYRKYKSAQPGKSILKNPVNPV